MTAVYQAAELAVAVILILAALRRTVGAIVEAVREPYRELRDAVLEIADQPPIKDGPAIGVLRGRRATDRHRLTDNHRRAL